MVKVLTWTDNAQDSSAEQDSVVISQSKDYIASGRGDRTDDQNGLASHSVCDLGQYHDNEQIA